MPIDSKDQEYQIARDGGVSKAGRKRTKKIFDDDMVYESVTNSKKDVKPVKKKPDKPKICDVSKSVKKQKKKIAHVVEVDEGDVTGSEVDEERITNESDDSSPPSTSMKQSKQSSQKEDQNSKSKKAKLRQEDDQKAVVTDETSPPATKLKKKRKPRTPKDDTSAASKQIKQESALEYLKQWHQQRQEWHFKKLHQIWLLENKYKEDQVTDAVFEVLLKYLENLQGGARERTTQEAVMILENSDMQDSDKKTQRAREILYSIQDS